ncbi:hypothetical protein Bhyg_15812 [Pseudolycoriella hygida]|uniref:Uncharacterized protein n=1 Tax=Pseudolycoriella hygida TaxID=35572 RepID=A0A9Q0MLY6_9DIPT|nr:hypothetical protein Bhyg_15812 [Pseudolycoriella hygida]
MVNERQIFCCGASSWTRLLAWLQIVGSSLLLLLDIIGIARVAAAEFSEDEAQIKTTVMAALAFMFIISFFGIIMGVILLKGTNQRRVSYLRAWIIYSITSLAVTIISIILNSSYGGHNDSEGTIVLGGVLAVQIIVIMFSVILSIVELIEIFEATSNMKAHALHTDVAHIRSVLYDRINCILFKDR